MTGDTPSTGPAGEGAAAAATVGLSCLPGAESASRPPRPTKADPDRQRLCIVSRTEHSPDELIRFVLGPDDRIVPDLARRLPGRGVWVTATHAAVTTAAKRGLFAKSLKHNVKSDVGLADQVKILLAAETRQLLSLANKAGLVTTGFSKVENALGHRDALALITASDASADGAGKLARKFKAIKAAANCEAPVILDLTSDELSLAIGGSNVIHALIARGSLGQRFIGSCQRLRRYCMNSDGLGIADAGTGAVDTVPQAIQAPLGTPHPGLEMSSVEETKSDQAGTDYE